MAINAPSEAESGFPEQHEDRIESGELPWGTPIRDDGTCVVDGVEAVGLAKYAAHRGVAYGHLLNVVEELGMQPIGRARSGNKETIVYRRSRIDALPYLTLPHVDANGIVTFDGKECVTLARYAKHVGVSYTGLQDILIDQNIEPAGTAYGNGVQSDAYLRSDIDGLDAVKKKRESMGDLDDEGILRTADCAYVAVKPYAIRHGMSNGRLKEAIVAAGLAMHGTAKAKSNAIVDVYLLAEVEALPYVQGYKANPKKPKGDIGIDVGGTRCVPVSLYAKKAGLDCAHLLAAIEKAELPVMGTMRSKAHVVDVYEESAITALAYVQDRANLPRVSKAGTVSVNGTPCVSLSAYGRSRGFHVERFSEAVRDAKIEPIGKALGAAGDVVDAYPLSLVSQTEYVRNRDVAVDIDENGIATLEDGREAIAIDRYSRKVLGISYGALKNAVAAAGLEKVGVGQLNHICDLYLRTEVDDLPFVKSLREAAGDLDDDGQIVINGVTYVGLSKWCELNKMTFSKLSKDLEIAGVVPAFTARCKKGVVGVFPLEEVRKLEHVRLRSRQVGAEAQVEIDGVPCVSIAKYARTLGTTFDLLDNAVRSANLRSLGNARSGTLTVPAYRKSEVDALPFVVAFLGATEKAAKDGTVTIDGTPCAYLLRWVEGKDLTIQTLMEHVAAAGIAPVRKVRYGGDVVEAYRLEDICRLDYVKTMGVNVADDGTVNVDGIPCVSIPPYAATIGVQPLTLQRWADEENLAPVGKARHVRRMVPVHRKSEIDALPKVRARVIGVGVETREQAIAALRREAEAHSLPIDEALTPEGITKLVRLSPGVAKLLEFFR